MRGVESGSNGSISTTQPNRCTSFGSRATSNRLSNRSHLRWLAAPVTPYRLSRAAATGSVTEPPLAKYWLKFSSPESTVPQGVMPPPQLLSVPRMRVPSGSADVFSRSLPAAGPVTSNGVVPVIRRLRRWRVTAVSSPLRRSSCATSTDSPWAAQPISACSRVGASGSYPANINCSSVYSWLITSSCRFRSPGRSSTAM